MDTTNSMHSHRWDTLYELAMQKLDEKVEKRGQRLRQLLTEELDEATFRPWINSARHTDFEGH